MQTSELQKLFTDVFAPQKGEKIVITVDLPHDQIEDNQAWQDRRQMAKHWQEVFQSLGDLVVDYYEFPATGSHNKFVEQNVLDNWKKYNVIVAMTEFSGTSSLKVLCSEPDSISRAASMPQVNEKMEETALKADYSLVKKYSIALKNLLNQAEAAEINFNTGDKLFLDLRNRQAHDDTGECVKTGQCINLPSGESYKVPYEAVEDEIAEFGENKTEGVMPVKEDGEEYKFIIKNNQIFEVQGDGSKAQELKKFFEQDLTRRNIAELGLGCNPKAIVSGNVLEDEKVGLHIAYGMSFHLGGKIKSDVHQDIVYAKGCPVEGVSVYLINKDGSRTEIIAKGELLYDTFIVNSYRHRRSAFGGKIKS